jgi:hypothetical protein
MNVRLYRCFCLSAAVALSAAAQEGAFELYSGREVIGPTHQDRNPKILEGLVDSTIGQTFARINPQRSLLLSDCGKASPWCGSPDFSFARILGMASRGLRLPDPATVAHSWFLSASQEARFSNALEPWHGALDKSPFQLLAIVNRMDLAHWCKERHQWVDAELRFVYGKKQKAPSEDPTKLTLIVEFVLPGLGWREFRQLGINWFQLGRAPNPVFLRALAAVLQASHCQRPAKVRIRTNLEEGGPWSFSEWDLLPGMPIRGDQPLARANLDDQISENFIAAQPATEEYDRYLTLWRRDITGQPGPQHIYIDGVFLHRDPTPYPDLNYPILPTPPKFCASEANRNALALERCSGCHAVETGTGFTHIANRAEGQSSVLSGFLVGQKENGQPQDITLADIYLGRKVLTVSFKYPTYTLSNDGWCDHPDQKTTTRHFYDLGRRRLFLAAVLIWPEPSEAARKMIEGFRTNYSD